MTRLLFTTLSLLSMSLLLSSTPGYAENTKEQDILLMLRASGQLEASEQIISGMVPQLTQLITQANPKLPQLEVAKHMKHLEGVLKREVPRLLELLVPVYMKHFSHEEIKQLISFYSSPIGKKFVEKQALIIPESMQVGQRWGQEAAQKAIQSTMQKIRKSTP